MVKCEILENSFNIGLVLTRLWERDKVYKVGASRIHVRVDNHPTYTPFISEVTESNIYCLSTTYGWCRRETDFILSDRCKIMSFSQLKEL